MCSCRSCSNDFPSSQHCHPERADQPLNGLNKMTSCCAQLCVKTRRYISIFYHFPTWASCQIRTIASAHAPGIPGTFSLPPQVSDPDMHHGTCVTHVPWWMPGSLITSGFLWSRRGWGWGGGGGGTLPGACATRNFTYLVRGPLISHEQFKPFREEDKDPFILCRQYQKCWCRNDIRSHGTGLVFRNIFPK